MNTETARKQRHKTGPKPIAEDRLKVSFLVARDLWDWAAEQPEGASRLLRDLLAQEQKRRKATSA